MNQKEYKLYDGRTITFFFDDGKVGYITLQAMDALVGEIQKLAAERDAAIDAVPVVRCGKCKWHENEEPGMVYCPQIVGGWVSENFFCGFGKQKDGGE